MTDYKALCARMADELDHYRQLLMDDRRETHALVTEARAARRPKPPSLKEQALALVSYTNAGDHLDGAALDTIRRALEQLPDTL
jgi:hypothetical protein